MDCLQFKILVPIRKIAHHDPAFHACLPVWADLWLVVRPGGVHADDHGVSAAGLAADARCGHLGGRAGTGFDGDAAGDGRGDCRGLRGAVLCRVAPAHHLAPPCAAGHVGLVGPGHGRVVEAVSRGRADAGGLRHLGHP